MSILLPGSREDRELEQARKEGRVTPLNEAAAKADGMTDQEWKEHEATIPSWVKDALA